MIYPGYMLNPGDMFQVDPERVLYATGAFKDKYQRYDGRRTKRQLEKPPSSAADNGPKADLDADDEAEADTATSSESNPEGDDKDSSTDPASATQKKALTLLLSRARDLLEDSKKTLPAKRKQDLRAFQQAVRRVMSRGNRATTEQTGDLDTQLQELVEKLSPAAAPASSSPSSQSPAPHLAAEDRRALKLALEEARENPIDPTRPYATPWRPRDFMSAFAFIPRYLEVNQNICSAVYLRHPVARPGLAEVPSPFGPETHQLAFNWYLKRR